MSHDTLPPLHLKQIGKTRWVLTRPFTYRGITVPEGFVTDGTSAPFRVLITSWGGHYAKAVVIHDYLYDCLNRGKPHPLAPTRKQADRIFRLVMKDSGVRPLVRLGMWTAVRLFGGKTLRRIGVR